MDESIAGDVADDEPSILNSPKAVEILEACEAAERTASVDTLVQLAISEGGFLHDDLRRKACKHSQLDLVHFKFVVFSLG